MHLRPRDGRAARLGGAEHLVERHAERRAAHPRAARRARARCRSARPACRARVVDHLPRVEVRTPPRREAQEQRGGEREVARREHADAPLAGECVDCLVVVSRQPARADDDPDAPLERGAHVALDGRRMGVVDEHVRVDGVEGLRDRREVVGVGARNAGDQFEVLRRADGLRHGPPVQPVIPATQTRITSPLPATSRSRCSRARPPRAPCTPRRAPPRSRTCTPRPRPEGRSRSRAGTPAWRRSGCRQSTGGRRR